MQHRTCRGQGTTWGIPFLLSTMWVLGTELRSSDFDPKHHLTGPKECFKSTLVSWKQAVGP